MSGVVLVLAGRDPTGGAGVDADLEALAAAGARGRAVVTNNTEQDGRQVSKVAAIASDVWARAALAAFDEHVTVVKSGLLSCAEQIDTLAQLVAHWRQSGAEFTLVVDPVLAASGGEVFLDTVGRERLLERLAELRPILTPNVIELAALTHQDSGVLTRDVTAREAAARQLITRGASAVCVKGGHGLEDPVVDLVVVAGAAAHACTRPRLVGRSMHGSGCRYASFLAGRIAAGAALVEAAEAAGHWLQSRLEHVARDA